MKYSRFPYYGAIIFALLLPALAISQYTAQSSMDKFYDANERFFAAVLAEDVTTLDQLLADDISFGLFNEKIKTKEAYLSAVKQQLLFWLLVENHVVAYKEKDITEQQETFSLLEKILERIKNDITDSTGTKALPSFIDATFIRNIYLSQR